MDYKQLFVNDNEFFNHYASTVPPTSNRHFYGTAISAVNDVPTIMSNAEISENTIGTSSVNSQPRIGIRLANLQRIKVYENIINFNFSSSPTENFTGISLVESNYARLNLNRVINNSTFFPTGSNEFLKGLDVARSTNLCIERCTLNNLGIGMYFTDVCIVNSLYLNTFANYDTAIFLNTADIGAIQGRGSPQNIVLGNSWSRTGTSSPLARRVEGIIKNGGKIDWYYQASTNNEFLPTSQNTDISPRLISSPSSISLCPPLFRFELDDEPPFTAVERNAIFGNIVGDSARYEENYYEEMRLINRYDLYLTLKNNPEILDLDDEADESFIEFYGELQEENIAIFDSVRSLTENGLYEHALELISAINDTNAIDSYLKECYSIYLNASLYDTVFSSSDSSILQEIAYLNPIVGGPGVIMARVLLNLEIYDEPMSGARIRNEFTENASEILFEVFPIPTHQLLSIRTNTNTENAHLLIHSIDGRMLRNFKYQSQIDITSLSDGVYFLTLKSENIFTTVKFLKN